MAGQKTCAIAIAHITAYIWDIHDCMPWRRQTFATFLLYSSAMCVDLTLMWLSHVSISSDKTLLFCPSDNNSASNPDLRQSGVQFDTTFL